MLDAASRFLKINRGATAIEYGMIAAGVALAIAGAVAIMGGSIGGVFGSLLEIMDPAEPPTGPTGGDTGPIEPPPTSNQNSGNVVVTPM